MASAKIAQMLPSALNNVEALDQKCLEPTPFPEPLAKTFYKKNE